MNSAAINAFCTTFLGPPPVRRLVYGINAYAEHLARLVTVDGFIDDFTEHHHWLGKPVLRLAEVPTDSWVVSCVTVQPKTALRRLAAHGIHHYLDYYAMAQLQPALLPQVNAVAATQKDHALHPEKYAWVRSLLKEPASLEVFDKVMAFRLTGDLSSMADFEYAIDRQYFEPFLSLRPGEVFVDGGGFDGDTTLEMASRCPDFASVHFFEPAAYAMTTAKSRLAALSPRIHFYPLGLYDRPTTLSFDASAGSASHIAEGGSDTIEVGRLDDLVTERISWIKMDLEGAELEALHGSERHILADHPKLAIAVYHDPADFWRTTGYVLGLRQDYTIHLRHYTEGWPETVMFFMPEQGTSENMEA